MKSQLDVSFKELNHSQTILIDRKLMLLDNYMLLNIQNHYY